MRNWRAVAGGAVALAVSLLASPAVSQPSPDSSPTSTAALIGPSQTFQQRCKACHEPAIDRAPGREELARLNPEDVVETLTAGSMAPMAKGLSRPQINELASYLTGRVPRAVASAPQPPDNRCTIPRPPLRATGSDWVGYGRDQAATRFQPNPKLRPADAGKLKLKWAFSMGGGRYGQPTVVGDHLFVSTGLGHVFDLDPATGCVHWRASVGSNSRTSPIVAPVKGRWMVFVGDSVRNIHALDAETGKSLWVTNVDKHPRGRITGSPAYADGVIYVPMSSSEETIATVPDYGCCTFSGSVTAIEAATGKVLWKTSLLPPAQPTRKNAAGTQMFGPAGAAIWSQPSLDPARGRVYVATGDSYTEVEETFSDAIVALDMKTGKVVWNNQVTARDNFLVGCGPTRRAINCPLGEIGPDHDFGASPIVAKAPGGRTVILAGQKSGVVYGIDPVTGRTQWATKVGRGGAIGGIEWGMAYDGRRVFAAVADPGQGPDWKPGLNALDPITGKLLWHVPAPKVPCSFKSPRCSNAHSAPVSAMPGVVFTGSHDGWFRAYDSASGQRLFEFDTAGRTYETVNGVKDQPGGSVDAVGPVVANGRVFVISGYTGATGAFGNPLNVLLAFEPER